MTQEQAVASANLAFFNLTTAAAQARKAVPVDGTLGDANAPALAALTAKLLAANAAIQDPTP